MWRTIPLVLGLCLGVAPAAEVILGEHAARPGSTATVPVFVPDATGIASIALQLNFDPEILTLTGVTNGPLGDGFLMDYLVDDGRVKLAATRDSSLTGGSGNLLILTFRVNAGATPGMASALAVADRSVGGQHGRDFAWSQTVSHSNGQVRVVSDTFDSNLNGLPDWWEESYFGGPTNASAVADSDGDGMTNLQEFLAGTDPLDPSSLLRVQSVTRTGGGIEIGFPSANGRTYRVEYSDDLRSWNAFSTNVPGTGGLIQIRLENALERGSRFYRLALAP